MKGGIRQGLRVGECDRTPIDPSQESPERRCSRGHGGGSIHKLRVRTRTRTISIHPIILRRQDGSCSMFRASLCSQEKSASRHQDAAAPSSRKKPPGTVEIDENLLQRSGVPEY